MGSAATNTSIIRNSKADGMSIHMLEAYNPFHLLLVGPTRFLACGALASMELKE